MNQWSAFRLAREVNQIIESKAAVKPLDSKKDFFQFDADQLTIYCSKRTLEEIARCEKTNSATARSYEAVLTLARRSAGVRALEVPEPLLYCLFSCLHEFGHFDYWNSTSEAKKSNDIRERDSFLLRRKAQAIGDSFYEHFGSESTIQTGDMYRMIPLEREADRFAEGKIVFVIERLSHGE